MANTKISALTANATLADDDVFPHVDTSAGSTKKVTLAVLKASMLASGTYTPTLTNTTNVASSSADVAQYMRVGSVVTVSGSLTIDTTAAGNTVLGISLPVASNFATATQCGGVATEYDTVAANEVGQILGDATNDRATLGFIAVAITARVWAYTFTYLIV